MWTGPSLAAAAEADTQQVAASAEAWYAGVNLEPPDRTQSEGPKDEGLAEDSAGTAGHMRWLGLGRHTAPTP